MKRTTAKALKLAVPQALRLQATEMTR